MKSKIQAGALRARTSLNNAMTKAGVLAITLAAPMLASAQTADPFSTAVTDVSTKVGTYGAALVGVAAIGVAFMVGIKYVKKISGAS